MSKEFKGIGYVLHRSAPVRVGLVELERCGAECTVALRLGERTVVTRLVPEWWVDDVSATGLLNRPVMLALRAVFESWRDAGLLRIDVAATATCDQQVWTLDDLAARWGGGPWMWSVPWSTVGLHLGRVLLPAPPELLVDVPIGEGVRDRLRAREEALRPYFDQVLWGDPGEAVARLIAAGGESGDPSADRLRRFRRVSSLRLTPHLLESEGVQVATVPWSGGPNSGFVTVWSFRGFYVRRCDFSGDITVSAEPDLLDALADLQMLGLLGTERSFDADVDTDALIARLHPHEILDRGFTLTVNGVEVEVDALEGTVRRVGG